MPAKYQAMVSFRDADDDLIDYYVYPNSFADYVGQAIREFISDGHEWDIVHKVVIEIEVTK